MRKSTMFSSVVLFAAAMMLSGCIFPYWDDDGRRHDGGHGGGHYEGGHREGGHRDGGERR